MQSGRNNDSLAWGKFLTLFGWHIKQSHFNQNDPHAYSIITNHNQYNYISEPYVAFFHRKKKNIVLTQKYFFILKYSADAKTFVTTQQGGRNGKDCSICFYRLKYHAVNFHELSSFAFQSLFHYVSVFFSPSEDEWMLNLIKQNIWSVLSLSKAGPLDLTV